MRCLNNDPRFDTTIKFFCGIDQFKSRPLRIFIRNAKLRLFHLECVYEGQWKEHCKEIARKYSNTYTLDFRSGTLQPQQWEVLGYVMSYSEAQWHFKCCGVFIEEKNLVCFCRHLSGRALHRFSLEEVRMNHSTVIHLSEICQSQEMLEELSIINCNLSDEDVSTFVKASEHHRSLKRLSLKGRTVASYSRLKGELRYSEIVLY